MRRTTLLIALLMLLLLTSEAFAKKRILVYTGSLLDERSAPIGGVFPLTFAFYKKSRGGAAVWSEKHFVAVDNGNYVVELGRKKNISRSIKLDSLFVGVRVTGGSELVRERFVAEGTSAEEIIHHSPSHSRIKSKPRSGGGPVELAQKASFAYLAEKAENSVRLDGLTLDQLKKALGSSKSGSVTVTIGDKISTPPAAGGDGGTPYRQLCPEGYVVTGLRGGSGLYVDRVQIMCSPLETETSRKKSKK